MSTTRRDFLRSSIAAGGALALSAAAGAAAMPSARRRGRKTLLILGGTSFIGPHIIEAAKAADCEVTIFNRGVTEARKQTPIDGVEKIIGDRDPDKGDGLRNLEARIKEKGGWDAVIDTSGYVPRITKASAELLAPVVGQYIFISSISVYADNSKPGDESAALAAMDDPTNEEVMANYGALKALCERSVEDAMPGRACNVRPGFIVGPGDPTDRFTYWPVRFDKGGDVLVPGTPDDPVQFIDVRDLASWLVHLVETRTIGVFNATGPIGGCTVGELVDACRAAARIPSEPVYIPGDFLQSQGVGGGVVTILIPQGPETAGFHLRSIDKAAAHGMKTRPIAETVRDTLAWWPVEVERRARVTTDLIEEAKAKGQEPPRLGDPLKLRAGLSPEQESAILTAWREHLETR